jgi:hypothetical protein
LSRLVDSGKTGYVIDKRRVQAIREQYGQSYPDFLMKFGRKYYQSQSIIGVLYRNAVMFKKGNVDGLNQAFAQVTMDDDQLPATPTRPPSSSVKTKKKTTRVKSTDQPKSAKK